MFVLLSGKMSAVANMVCRVKWNMILPYLFRLVFQLVSLASLH
jgi:hypothetical protein